MDLVQIPKVNAAGPLGQSKAAINRAAKLRPETLDEKCISIVNLLKLTARAMSVYQICEACEFSETSVRALIKRLRDRNEIVFEKGLASVPKHWQ